MRLIDIENKGWDVLRGIVAVTDPAIEAALPWLGIVAIIGMPAVGIAFLLRGLLG